MAAFVRWALSQSRCETGADRQAKNACLEKPRPPAGHRDGDPVDGQFADQRVHL